MIRLRWIATSLDGIEFEREDLLELIRVRLFELIGLG